jgi:hypothetical protein
MTDDGGLVHGIILNATELHPMRSLPVRTGSHSTRPAEGLPCGEVSSLH